ncbi:MAG: hypothetical protein RL367_519, partial [Pseudomonadota bacterium]
LNFWKLSSLIPVIVGSGDAGVNRVIED